MNDSEYKAAVEAFVALTEKLNDEPTGGQVFAILADMAKLVDATAEAGCNAVDALEMYLNIGSGYYGCKHYLFALEYYDKALERLESCRDAIEADEDLRDALEEGFINMLDMCKKMEKETESKALVSVIQTVTPSSIDAMKKARRSSLKNDPVEYTEAYMAILPELEVKIDAELEGVSRGMGFCFGYWRTKKEILKRDYGIEWDSPGVLNPHVRFD